MTSAEQQQLTELLPNGVYWGDPLTPFVMQKILEKLGIPKYTFMSGIWLVNLWRKEGTL